MYIQYNKVHGIHDLVYQIQSPHHFIHSVVRGLSLANHDRALTRRTVRKPMLELVNHKRNPLVHQSIQVRLGTRHFYHHANLKKQKKTFQCPGHKKKNVTLKKKSLTDNR